MFGTLRRYVIRKRHEKLISAQFTARIAAARAAHRPVRHIRVELTNHLHAIMGLPAQGRHSK